MNRVMSRVVNIAALVPPVLLTMGLLGGCPIYGDQDRHRICNTNGCFDCPTDTLTDACTAWECTTSWDCPAGRQCNRFRRCAAIADTTDGGGQCKAPSECTEGLTCGGDNLCHAENCSVVSCPTGFRCELKGGQAQCTATTDGGTSNTDGGPSARACSSNADCPTLGEKCINAQCTAAAKQCSNSTHCVAGSQCVEGTCTPSCSTSKPCPTGYACDEARGVCSANSAPTACASSGQCSGGNVCVTGHCVTPCADAGVCGAGQLCVLGGCIPDQRATFTCNESGTLAEGVQDTCNAGSICLRRSCYIACDPNVDGGSVCKSADTFNQCKSVSVASATFSICSSATGLGTECSPTVPCTAGRICVDGLCR